MNRCRGLTGWFFVWLSVCTVSEAAKPPLHTLIVSTSTTVAAGSALYLAVDRPELSSLTTTGASRMFNPSGNQWIGRVAVQGSTVSTSVNYKLTTRTTSSGTHCTTGNGSLSGTTYTTNVPLWNPGYSGKTIYYHSSWTNAFILYRVGNSATFADAPMTRIGSGRTAGEYRYQVTGIGEPGRPLEFVPHGRTTGGVEQYDNPAVGGIGSPANYYTSLDTFFLQDGNIFNYTPPATVSAPQVITVGNWNSSYTGNGIPTRSGRIYLPRGYTQNTSKRYPVLYMHDGQNVFDPGGSFGSWSADAAATREITQGRMRETIIVAVNNTGSRMSEYGTPQDGYTGNYYLLYLVNNVKPNIDANYRTLTDFMNTGNMGSSLGGLISAYIGLSSNVFGLVGAVSPSYWYGPNFRNYINTQNTKGNRIYQDAGTSEGTSMWDYFWPVLSYYQQDGYTMNDDIMIAIGCGEAHNEAAWANRVANGFRFLYNPWDEVNLLETNVPAPAGTLQFTASTTNVFEPNGSVRVYVSRAAGSNGAASVNYATSNGTASAGSDYTAASGTLNWTNNDASTKFIDVTILNDTNFEGGEVFSVRLSGASGASMGSPSIINVSILDDDQPPPQLVITNPPVDILVGENIDTYEIQGVAIVSNWQGLAWSNNLTGSHGVAPISSFWTVGSVNLGYGANLIRVSATNGAPAITTNAADSAADPAYAGGWTTNNNGGFGFGPWYLYTSSSSVNSNGNFIGNSATVKIGIPAWGLYANGGNLSEAKRTLPGPLGLNQTLSVDFENGIVDVGAGIGVALQNASGDTLWQFFYNGGDTFYSISGNNTDINNTTNGVHIEFSLTGPTNYSAKITPLGGTLRTITGNLDSTVNSTNITVFRCWNFNAGPDSIRDVFFNNLKVTTSNPGGTSTSDYVTITRESPSIHDGIPMFWWNQYGLGTNNMASDDNDSDGNSNYEEYIADTDPTNSASVYNHRVESIDGQGVTDLRTGPPTSDGRLYDVWFTPDLMNPTWTPLNLDIPGASDGSAVSITVTNSGDVGHYRTGVKLP
jgi:predicted alpha/beta superfamily hydrolase